MTSKDYTILEVRYLENNPDVPVALLAHHLGRPIQSVRNKRHDLGIVNSHRHYWTDEKINTLRELYKTHSYSECAEIMNIDKQKVSYALVYYQIKKE